MNIVKDGRTIDSLENFRWPFLVGGPADGKEVPGQRCWANREIEVEDEIYVRHRFNPVGAPARIGYFVARNLPQVISEAYALHRRILNSHPDLQRLDDIVIDTDGKTHQDEARRKEREKRQREYEKGNL